MKKITLGIAALSMVAISMGACGKKDNAANKDNNVPATEQAAPAQDAVAPEQPDAIAADQVAASASSDYTATPSGLKYKVIKEGTGKQPKATDMVLVNYEGRLLDGTIFDSSYQRGEPIAFALNSVIPGWTEGVQLMKEGSTYEFYIPSNLAYGERGAGGVIPPNADLIFLVELIEVQ